MNRTQLWQPFVKKVESLPKYCKLILTISILISSITIGFSLGIILNKDKYQNIQKQIENQQKQEEAKLNTFLKSNQINK